MGTECGEILIKYVVCFEYIGSVNVTTTNISFVVLYVNLFEFIAYLNFVPPNACSTIPLLFLFLCILYFFAFAFPFRVVFIIHHIHHIIVSRYDAQYSFHFYFIQCLCLSFSLCFSMVLYFILFFYSCISKNGKCVCVCVCIYVPIRLYIGWLVVWQEVYYYMITMSLVTFFLMASISKESVYTSIIVLL